MTSDLGAGMDDTQVERLISTETVAGLDYVYGIDQIQADRDRNYDYARGIMNDLPSPPGRSSVVIPVIANYIGLLKPNLLRIFTAGRNIVEYASPKPELKDGVRLITRFVNDIVFRKDNRGELLLNDWADDALIQKVGVVMYWWEDSKVAKDVVVENIPDMSLPIVLGEIQQQGAEIVEAGSNTVDSIDPMTQQPMQSMNHSLKVRTWENTSKCRIECIPPEEFVISRDARTIEDAVLVGHRAGVMVGELIAQGYDPEVVKRLPNWTPPYIDSQKYNQNLNNDPSRDNSADPMLKKVAVIRGILRCDRDGTGIKEWYVVAGGEAASPKLLEMAPYNNQLGFADFCPEPLPHTVFGRCPADRLASVQKVTTVLTRQYLDALYLGLSPQREVVMDWIVKPDQLLNMSPAAPVMVKQPGAIREIKVPDVGADALQGIGYFDSQAEITSGVSRMSAGLDPEVLQNQSATASANQQSASLGRVEMMARIWAHGGMRKLFRGVFLCLKAYQDFARVVTIDGAPQTINPAIFRELDDVDVNVNTGLGTGNRDRDFALLGNIASMQQEVLKQFGPDNPIVGLDKITRTLQLICESAGISYPENFFGDAKTKDGQPWMPPPPAPPQPSPDTVMNAQTLEKIEMAKIESDERKKIADIASRERVDMYKINVEAALKAEQIGVDKASVLVDAAKADADQVARDMTALQ